jgi:glutamate-1-semialdehyde 2,1-aminomutase
LSTVAEARAELAAKTAQSRSIAGERSEILNSGLAANLEMPHPIFIHRGEGAYVYDADGNEYLDTSVGFGLHMLGHRHPEVEQAIKARTELGWMFGIHTTAQLNLARLLHDASPCAQRVVFCNTGSEATMYAIRAARAFSGRERIALFDGFYHGAHDYGMWITDPDSPREAPRKLPMGHGIPRALDDLVVLLPYRDRAAFDLIRRHANDLALVLVEGVQSSNPQPGAGEFLRELAEVCRAHDVLFGIDEVITGFRLAYGGAQERFGVTADLAAYGKVLGGGLPVGAITGRADLMEVFTGLGSERGMFSGGTFSGNPLTMEAGTAAVSHLARHPEIYQRLDAAGDRLAAGVNGFCEAHQIPAQMKHVGSMFHMFFQREPVQSMRDVRLGSRQAEKAFYLHALNRGVLVPGTQRAFLSAAHGEKEIDRLIDVFQSSLTDVRDEGLFET